jgi:hypothetical protein
VATEKYVFNRNDNQKPKFCTKTVHQYDRNYQDCSLAIKKIGDKTIYTFKLRGTSQVFVEQLPTDAQFYIDFDLQVLMKLLHV